MLRFLQRSLLKVRLGSPERFVFSPGVLELRTNCVPVYGFVYGIAPAWGGSDDLPASRVLLEWRVSSDDRELQPVEGSVVRYTGRKMPGGGTARMVLRWQPRHPVLACNPEYIFWSALRGTAGHQLPGTILSDAATAALLSNALSPIHCSAVAKDGQAVVLIAPSNTGKTTTAWNLVSRHGFDFLAEDIAITDGRDLNGAAFTGTGLPQPFPPEHIGRMERARRALFPIWLKQSLASRLPAGRVQSSAKIRFLVFLERGPSAVREVPPDRAADLLLRNNRLEFRYLGSPHLVRSWYNGNGPDLGALSSEEARLLQLMVESSARVVMISEPDPDAFAGRVLSLFNG